jgi:hypothetical protein
MPTLQQNREDFICHRGKIPPSALVWSTLDTDTLLSYKILQMRNNIQENRG